MDIGDWFLLLAVIVNVAVWRSIRGMIDEQKRANKQQVALLGLLTARQSRMKFDHTTRQAPGVDAKARTTRRDTHDIPTLGGTQRPMKMKIVGGPDEPPQEA